MCYYIIVAISEKETNHLNSDIPRGLRIKPISNPSINKQLPEEFVTFTVTRGECSCSLFDEEFKVENREESKNRLVRKYKAKGWSKAKIERALTQHISNKNISVGGLDPEVLFYLADIAEKAEELKIITHWYTGDIESERITLSKDLRVSTDRLRHENPVTKTDHIYTIVRIN